MDMFLVLEQSLASSLSSRNPTPSNYFTPFQIESFELLAERKKERKIESESVQSNKILCSRKKKRRLTSFLSCFHFRKNLEEAEGINFRDSPNSRFFIQENFFKSWD